jgi:CHAT domain-containing protein/Flp pilus assembly protein TadD
MKCRYWGIFLSAILMAGNIYGQPWKQFADSAKSLRAQHEFDSSILYYTKAQQELMIDSVWTTSYALVLNDFGNLLFQMGRNAEAEKLYLESKSIREKVVGKSHPLYAFSCANLGNLYKETGSFKKSEEYQLTAIAIFEAVFGTEHPYYARACKNLGNLYLETGQYEKAEYFFIKSSTINEKVFGEQSAENSNALLDLGNLYYRLGQFEKAENIYLRSVNIDEKLFGKESLDYAYSSSNLGTLYQHTGQFQKAETYLVKAQAIIGAGMGNKNPDYAKSCGILAILYSQMGDYEKAEKLYGEAKEISLAVFGKDHPAYAIKCENLGTVYKVMGQYEKAEPQLLEALQIDKKTLGVEHPSYAGVCTKLAELYWCLKNTRAASDFFSESFNSQLVQVKKVFQFTNETEKELYLKEMQDYYRELLSFQFSTNAPANQGFTYTVSVASRNLILSSFQRLRYAIFHDPDTALRNRYDDWISKREQIAFWYGKSLDERGENIRILEDKVNALEKELASRSRLFKNQLEKKEPDWKDIQQSLKPTEAAIEFAEFPYYNGKRQTDSIYYIALILRKDMPEPTLVPLFEKRQLDSVLDDKTTSPGQHRLTFLYSRQNNRTAGGKSSLYDLIWQPMEGKLGGIRTIYFAAAGLLHKIAFAALAVSPTQVLSDQYRLVQLNSTAAIPENSMNSLVASDNIFLYGGVQYDEDSLTMKRRALKFSENDVATRSLPDDLLRGGVSDFYYLSQSGKEVDDIARLGKQRNYEVTLLKDMTATEESVKALSGKNTPAVLHFATHGFFFPDPKNRKKDEQADGAQVFQQSDNPLIRSGLALAGANNAWKGKPVAGIDDGILTAYEVSNMYLPNTKLVVLSACETGLGDIQGSEGVYGLQRAFKMAGVQNLVMSLWKVDDLATSNFMEEFYKNLFGQQTINDAFYNAQTTLKNKYRNDPYKWAAWILVR